MVKSGREISGARLMRGWWRKDLAVAAGVSITTVASWERRDRIPDPMPPSLAKIVAALGEDAIEEARAIPEHVTVRQPWGR
jgi:DNA-binding transcriptional regulator YiaG